MSEYVSNDQYVQKQKEDIQELSEIFRTLLGDDEDPMSSSDPYIRAFSSHFHGIPDISVRFTLEITDEDRCLYITADGDICIVPTSSRKFRTTRDYEAQSGIADTDHTRRNHITKCFSYRQCDCQR